MNGSESSVKVVCRSTGTITHYVNGKLHGDYYAYWDEGMRLVRFYGKFNMGDKIGIWKYYNIDVELLGKYYYL